MIREWLNLQVTKEMLRLVSDIQAANKEQLTGLIINGPSFGQQDLHILSQLKGQILALDEVLKTKEFLQEILTKEEEVINEVTSSRT